MTKGKINYISSNNQTGGHTWSHPNSEKMTVEGLLEIWAQQACFPFHETPSQLSEHFLVLIFKTLK